MTTQIDKEVKKQMDRAFLIADNQDITRAGLLFLLMQDQQSRVCQNLPAPLLLEAGNKGEMVHQLKIHPDAVVVVDYTLFDFHSSDELLAVHERFKQSQWLLFSEELSEAFLRQMVFSSPRIGVVLKECSQEEILEALQGATKGKRYICHQMEQLLAGNMPSNKEIQESPLTPTEQTILKEIALGKSTKEIAQLRNLSFHTVNTHRKNIFRKLGVNNAQEASRYAVKAGIVDLVEYYI